MEHNEYVPDYDWKNISVRVYFRIAILVCSDASTRRIHVHSYTSVCVAERQLFLNRHRNSFSKSMNVSRNLTVTVKSIIKQVNLKVPLQNDEFERIV